jgi:hypothetical protein
MNSSPWSGGEVLLALLGLTGIALAAYELLFPQNKLIPDLFGERTVTRT